MGRQGRPTGDIFSLRPRIISGGGYRNLLEADNKRGLVDLRVAGFNGTGAAHVVLKFRDFQRVDRIHFNLRKLVVVNLDS